MATQWIDANLYLGRTGAAITSAAGSSGTLCGSVKAQQVDAMINRHLARFNRGFPADGKASVNLGYPSPLVTVTLMDDTWADVMAELALSLSGANNVLKSGGSGGEQPGRLAGSFQLAIRPIVVSGTPVGPFLYSPRAVPAFDFRMFWGRGERPLAGAELTFHLERSADQTKPAFMIGPSATLDAIYF